MRALLEKYFAKKQYQQVNRLLLTVVSDLFLSKADIKQRQVQKLLALIEHAKSNSRFYHRHLSQINVDNFDMDNLQQIPILTKKSLMQNWDQIITVPNIKLEEIQTHLTTKQKKPDRLYYKNRYHVFTSSGSTGQKGIFIYSKQELNQYQLMQMRYGTYLNQLSQDGPKLKRCAQVGVTNTIYLLYALLKTFDDPSLTYLNLAITKPIDKITYQLNNFKPEILIALPSTINKLCIEQKNSRLNIKPITIWLTSEPLSIELTKLIKQTWPTSHLINFYGATEGLSAISCPYQPDTLHLNEDMFIMESIDSTGQRVPVNKVSDKILLTNLYNTTLPLIRFEMSDRIMKINAPCQCPISHQRIQAPQGRLEQTFFYDDIAIHPTTVVTTLLHQAFVYEYQVYQTKNGLYLKIVPSGELDLEIIKTGIENTLLQSGLKAPKVEIELCQNIALPDSGKLKRFIS